jgi:hypothetical protein
MTDMKTTAERLRQMAYELLRAANDLEALEEQRNNAAQAGRVIPMYPVNHPAPGDLGSIPP